jgi:hypothetical protein
MAINYKKMFNEIPFESFKELTDKVSLLVGSTVDLTIKFVENPYSNVEIRSQELGNKLGILNPIIKSARIVSTHSGFDDPHMYFTLELKITPKYELRDFLLPILEVLYDFGTKRWAWKYWVSDSKKIERKK